MELYQDGTHLDDLYLRNTSDIDNVKCRWCILSGKYTKTPWSGEYYMEGDKDVLVYEGTEEKCIAYAKMHSLLGRS